MTIGRYVNPENHVTAGLVYDNSFNLVGNYSTVAVNATYEPDANELFHITNMIVFLEASSAFVLDNYTPTSPLINGIKFSVQRPQKVSKDLTDLFNIVRLADYIRFVGSGKSVDAKTGNTNSFATIGINFTTDGQTTDVDGRKGEYFSAVLNDDFTSLVEHNFILHGWKEVLV